MLNNNSAKGDISSKACYKEYLKILKERSKTSRVYKKFQLIGLVIAQLLNDEKHKSLYIKLAKKYDNEFLISLAKDVSERKNIENKGAYFTKIFFNRENKK